MGEGAAHRRILGALVVAGLRRHTTYRTGQLAAAASNTVFGVLRSVVLLGALAGAGGEVAGYDRETAVAFVFVSQALLHPVHIFPWSDLSDRVRSGDIAVDLARPVDLQLQFAAADLGRAASTVLPNMVPPLVVGQLIFGWFLPLDPVVWLLGASSVLLAVAVSFACRYLLGLASFWIIEVRGVTRIYQIVSAVLCGMIVPITWFPGWLHTIAVWSPFPGFIQIPADLVAGRVTGADALSALGTQVVWAVLLLALGHATTRRATRRLVIQGG